MVAVAVLVNVVQTKKEQRHNADVKQSVVICIAHDGMVSLVTIAHIVVSQSVNYIWQFSSQTMQWYRVGGSFSSIFSS